MGLDLRHSEDGGLAPHFKRLECESAAKMRGLGRANEGDSVAAHTYMQYVVRESHLYLALGHSGQ